MSTTTTTYPWKTTQTIKAANLVSTALSPYLSGHNPTTLLVRMQTHADLLRKKLEAALEEFVGSFGSPFKYDKTQCGWELVRPVEGVYWRVWPADPTAVGPTVPTNWDPNRIPEMLEGVAFLHEGEDRLLGLEMWERALCEYGCSDGQFLAEWLLEHQQYIPVSWRGNCLVFPGTVWRSRDGSMNVAYLRWKKYDLWCLEFHTLHDGGWCREDRLVRRRSPTL